MRVIGMVIWYSCAHYSFLWIIREFGHLQILGVVFTLLLITGTLIRQKRVLFDTSIFMYGTVFETVGDCVFDPVFKCVFM